MNGVRQVPRLKTRAKTAFGGVWSRVSQQGGVGDGGGAPGHVGEVRGRLRAQQRRAAVTTSLCLAWERQVEKGRRSRKRGESERGSRGSRGDVQGEGEQLRG